MNAQLMALLGDPDIQMVRADPLRYLGGLRQALYMAEHFGEPEALDGAAIDLMHRVIDKIQAAL